MHHMICLCLLSVCIVLMRCKAAELWMLTSGKHALHEVVDIAKNNSEALWNSLLSNQRFDLDALQYWLRYSSVGVRAGVENCTEEQRKYLLF